jgi:hypothetical protein
LRSRAPATRHGYTSTTAPVLANRQDVGNRWLLPRMQGSTIKTDRRKIVRPTDFQFCLEIPGPRTRIFTLPTSRHAAGFPHTILCLVTGAEFAQREFFEGALRSRSRAASRPSLPSSSAWHRWRRRSVSPATSPRGGTGRAQQSATTWSRPCRRGSSPADARSSLRPRNAATRAEDPRRVACRGRR